MKIQYINVKYNNYINKKSNVTNVGSNIINGSLFGKKKD